MTFILCLVEYADINPRSSWAELWRSVVSVHLNSPLGHMTQEGQVAQDIKGHGRAPDGALARQAPLPVIYGTTVNQQGVSIQLC